MKIIILLTLLTLITCKTKYKLTIYQTKDCNYCKFATNQIKSLVNENHWENILDLQIVYCQNDPSLCKDSSVKPMLTLSNLNNEKLAQIGGVRSKIFFKDWIANIVDKNPIKTQKILDNMDKYRKIVIKNKQQVKDFYQNQIERQRKIKNDKLDILKNAQKYIQQHKGGLDERTNQNLTQDSQQASFRNFFRRVAVISKYLLVVIFLIGCIIWIKNFYQNRHTENSSRIPANDYQQSASIYSK